MLERAALGHGPTPQCKYVASLKLGESGRDFADLQNVESFWFFPHRSRIQIQRCTEKQRRGFHLSLERSAPVPGRSNVPERGGTGAATARQNARACCPRARAHS